MNRLLSLEIQKNRLGPYHMGTLVCGVALLAFQYLMSAIPHLDPTETDQVLFSSYGFLLGLDHLLGMAAFGILGGMMGAKVVVQAYSGRGRELLFSHPVGRKEILGAKLRLIYGYPAAAMLLWGTVTGAVFLLTEGIFPLCAGTLAAKTVWWGLCSLLCHVHMAGAVGILAAWIGLCKRSVPGTIVAAVLLAMCLCQVLSLGLTWPLVYPAVLGATAVGVALAVKNIGNQVEQMEV